MPRISEKIREHLEVLCDMLEQENGEAFAYARRGEGICLVPTLGKFVVTTVAPFDPKIFLADPRPGHISWTVFPLAAKWFRTEQNALEAIESVSSVPNPNFRRDQLRIEQLDPK